MIKPTLPSPLPTSMPSYNCCAVRIVRCAVKPSLRPPSCCKVDVINGAVGFLFLCFFSTFSTTNAPTAASKSPFLTCEAFLPSVIENWLILSSSKRVNFAIKFLVSASIVQYSLGSNFSISASRSQIKRKEGLCTLPADNPGLIFFHNNGERLNPTK